MALNKERQSIRFIHSSDLQLGMTRHFLSDEALPRFIQARIDAIKKLGDLSVEHDAAFIVVSGDVFESNQLSRQTVLRSLNALQELPVPIFLLPGNHDPLDATSIFSNDEFMNSGNNIIVLRDTSPIKVPGHPYVEVVGAPWHTKHPSLDLCADLFRTLDSPLDVIRIAVGHGQLDTLSPDKSRPEIIGLVEAETAVSEGRIHYLALGDRHSVTESGATGRIWYSGSPVATDFTEDNPNKALLVELDGRQNCSVEQLEVGGWNFIAEKRDLNNAADLQSLEDWFSGLPNKECTIIKISFEGTINLSLASQLDQLLDDYAELFASLKRRMRVDDLIIAPDAFDQECVTLNGYARDAWDSLLTQADHDPTAQGALRLYYRLSQQS